MAGREDIKSALRKLASDPEGVQALLDSGKQNRKGALAKHGVQGFNRKEVADEIQRLLSQSSATQGGATTERAVEWAGVIAVVVAGALAA